jgi:hypothetical protein
LSKPTQNAVAPLIPESRIPWTLHTSGDWPFRPLNIT